MQRRGRALVVSTAFRDEAKKLVLVRSPGFEHLFFIEAADASPHATQMPAKP